MGSITGQDGILKIDDIKVIQARSWSIDETSDTAENTVIGAEARTFKKSMVGWSGSIDVYYDTDDIAIDDLFPGMQIELQLYPSGENIGNAYYLGNAVITSLTNGSSFDGMTERSVSFQGSDVLQKLNYLGLYEGYDACDKPGDVPGECTEPDYRNPSERFTELVYEDGDSYTVSDVENFVPAHINLVDEVDGEIRPIQVYNDETIIFKTVSAPGTEGWYIIQRDILAENVLFDDSGTITKGENVQVFNEALDAVANGALQSSGGTMTGLIICEQGARVSNGQVFASRNFADNANLNMLYADSSDRVFVGGQAGSPQTNIRAAGVIAFEITSTEITANLPIILPNNTALKLSTLGGTAFTAVSITTGNIITLGDGSSLDLTVQILQNNQAAIQINNSQVAVNDRSLRLSNTSVLNSRNAADTVDVTIAYVDSSDIVWLGGSGTSTQTNIRAVGVTAFEITSTEITALLPIIETALVHILILGPSVVNFLFGRNQSITCGGDTQLTFNAPADPGKTARLKLKINTGGYTVTMPAGCFFPDGIAPVIDDGVWLLDIFYDGDYLITPQKFAAV